MRAVSLHRDVLVATSAVLQVNCVIVRGPVAGGEEDGRRSAPGDVERESPLPEQESPVRVIEPGGEGIAAAEVFVIDSPVLPEELETLSALLAQAHFPEPSGLLATHGDWDHLLGRLAFPGVALGCAESTAERLQASPGEAQRELRTLTGTC